MPEDASPEWVEDAARGMQVNTTACKRLFSLGCVPHTDGAVLQFSRLKKHAKGFGQRKDFAYQLTTGML